MSEPTDIVEVLQRMIDEEWQRLLEGERRIAEAEQERAEVRAHLADLLAEDPVELDDEEQPPRPNDS